MKRAEMSSGKPALSMRGGVMVMKGISLFLAGSRNTEKRTTSVQQANKSRSRKKMTRQKDDNFKCSLKTLEAVKRDTLFSRVEIESLYKIFKKLVIMNKIEPNPGSEKAKNCTKSVIGKSTNIQEGIDRVVFREILHNTFDIVAENTLMDRIFCVWDKLNSGTITLESWFCGLSIYLKESPKKLVEFCFNVYDLNADGFITKDEIFQLLRNSLTKHPQEEDPDESVKELVDIVMKKIDKDKDGKVSLDDYIASVEEEPLLLEAFGKCLPSERSKQTFLSTLKA